MKKITFILVGIVLFLLALPSVYGQSVPQGMKYQAVARDLAGEVMADQPISIKIALQGNDKSKTVHYIEVHDVTTNQFGLFSLVVGNGAVTQGDFNKIPWSSEDIWMEIGLKNAGESGFATISSSKLLAVPYAFHAGTASKIVDSSFTTDKLTQKSTGVPSQNWSLFGNSKSDPEKDKLGTTDATDFVFITNNEERLRITADGEIKTKGGKFTIGGNLEVQGDSTRINNDLYVGRNVVLNFDDGFNPRGETVNHGNFTVKNMSATELTGTLDVFKETNLKSTLTVTEDGMFEDDLTVKDTLFAEKIVTKRFNIKDDVLDGGFLATFENTNNGNGDGINIKLGKKGVKFYPDMLATDILLANGNLVGELTLEQRTNLKNLLQHPIPNDDDLAFLFTLGAPSVEELAAIPATACTLTTAIVNKMIDIVNVPISTLDVLGVFGNPPIDPIPAGVCNFLGNPFSFPTLKLEDAAYNSLSGENVFIEFSDSDNKHMGAIKGQSITDWVLDYFDKTYLFELASSLKGIDKTKLFSEMKLKSSEIAKSYYEIGVEYSSGNGDYAEWLERIDAKEDISYGDIVAVVGGKITKDLSNAEQVMAVSYRPIVLGNIPSADKENLGNNIAFMGQIPVKIMGPVVTGDYIVGNGVIKGYGVAIHPENMTVEDFKFAVGRSWASNTDSGPKLVNTVVGVHNGDFIHILKKMQDKFNQSEVRLETVEAKIDILTGMLSANNSSN